MAYKKIGELCLEKGLINTRQLEDALNMQQETGLLLSAVFVKMGLLTKDQIYDLLQEQNSLIKRPTQVTSSTQDIMHETAILMFVASEDHSGSDAGTIHRIDLLEVSGFRRASSLSVVIDSSPSKEISEKFGITDESIKLDMREAMKKVRDFCSNSYIFTYHAPRDYSLLKSFDHTRFLKGKLIGILTLWRRLHPGPGHGYISLEELLQQTRYTPPAVFDHNNALWAIHHLYTEVITELKVKKKISSLVEAWNFFGRDLDENEVVDSTIFDKLEKAINAKSDLTILYRSPWTTEDTRRTITPKEIKKQAGKLHVIAYCHLRGAERWFKLERIKGIST